MKAPTTGKYAGVVARMTAMYIDCFILGLISFGFAFATSNTMYLKIAYQVLCLVYFTAFEGSPKCATPGKMALKIYVAGADGYRMSYFTAAARYIVWVLPFAPALALVIIPHYSAILTELASCSPAASCFTPEKMAFIKMAAAAVIGGFAAQLLLYWGPALFTRETTGLHDMVTKTRVYKLKKA